MSKLPSTAQVVVIGGGIINGLSQQDVWPRQRIHELLEGDRELRQRWERLIELSAAMADDESVPSGTRYDALRILGTDRFEKSGPRLKKYLTDKDAELQMGAISGLADMESDGAAEALIAAFPRYTDSNRQLAVAALFRTDTRRALLRRAMETGQISRDALSAEQAAKLKP